MSVTPGLFESTDGRGDDAPPGVLFIWGGDVSSKRVSIAVECDPFIDLEGERAVRAVQTHAFTLATHRDVGERLAIIYSEVHAFARRLVQRYPPEQVSVESPAMNPHGGSEPILEYTTGVVVAALSMALAGVPVWMVPVKRWKARALGNGNVDKAETLRWARAEFGATIEDEADAAGVCRAAKLTVWGGLCDEKDVKRGAVPRNLTRVYSS